MKGVNCLASMPKNLGFNEINICKDLSCEIDNYTKIGEEKKLERKIFRRGKCYLISSVEGGGGDFVVYPLIIRWLGVILYYSYNIHLFGCL